MNATILLYGAFALATLWPGISSGAALLMGVAFSFFAETPDRPRVKAYSGHLMQLAIVGIGAGMDLGSLLRAGLDGFIFTVVGISLTFALGWGLQRLLRTAPGVSILLSAGTAICGASAIAAVSATLRSEDEDISTSMAIVFLLNTVALFVFPPVGHYWGLNQAQFGYWSGVAIHDTSSVVGAALQYGAEALNIATAVKLARAIWIIPLCMLIGWFARGRVEEGATRKYPWFILGFVAMAALVTWVPVLQEAGLYVQAGAKRLLVLTLFLIGSLFPRSAWRSRRTWVAAGHGILLWLAVASATLGFVTSYR